MTDALEDHEGTVNIGGRTITNLRFANDIDGLAGEEELAKLVERLVKAYIAYGMKISAEKTKLMTDNTNGINTSCKMVLARPDERETCPYHFSLRLFTMVKRSSCGPIACWILARTSCYVTWSLLVCMRCGGSCGSTSLPWLVFIFGSCCEDP